MTTPTTNSTSTWSTELEAIFAELRDETLLLVLPGLFMFCVVVLVGAAQFRTFAWSLTICLALFFLGLAVVILRRRSYLAPALLLIIGCVIIDLLAVIGGGVEPAIYLMVVPVGLTTLFISRIAGVTAAALCSALVLFAPTAFLPLELEPRAVAALSMWSTVGIIWLTLRPSLTVAKWAWQSYERNQVLLEQARDYQVKLQETLEDLSAVNIQLSRLNQQAHTFRLAAEEERRAKERFVANISHELRTPLNMIIGFAEVILQAPQNHGPKVPPSLLADLAVILRNSQHLSSLVDDVLALSQIEAGQMALTKERVSLAEIVQAASTAVRPLYESKNLYLKMDIPEVLPLIFCDRTRIREVVLNLLSNAGRFTENGGVQVRAWQTNKEVVVSIADTGPGIAEADQDKLFKPFHQLEHPVRRHYGGSGLGLSISKNFVELHDGRMWIESQPGQGTTVFFQLPIDLAPTEDRSARRWFNIYQLYEKHVRVAHLQLPVVRPRLVVLEKGDALQHLLHRYLTEAEIVPTADLEQACQELTQVPSQALLINDMEVGEALQRVHEFAGLPPGVPAMVCSIPGLEQTTSALGVVDYLVKPVGREALLAALDRLGRPVQTVLIVDDAPDALQLFGRILNMAGRGYRVWRASDGSQALEICRMQRPDVILLDLMMPEMDGFQFLRARKLEPALAEVPVILISARDPLGKPIVSNVLAVTRKDGLSVQQLLAGVEALKQILSPANLPTDPALPATAPD